MHARLVLATAAAVLVLAARPMAATACSICGCGDPLVDVSDSVPNATRFRLALDLEYLSASAGGDMGGAESVTQITLRPVFVYSPLESLNLILELPLARKEWSMAGIGAPSATETGLGDLDVGGRWFFFQARSFERMSRQGLGLSLGVSLPTGPNDATQGGVRLDDHAQLGTGSFGPYVGLVWAYHEDPWNVFTSVTLRTHTTNDFGYRYGTALAWTVRGDYRLHDRLALELGVDGRFAAMDSANGDMVDSTGGLLLAVSPGVAVNATGDLWLRARVQVPFVSVLEGVQDVGPTFFLSANLLLR